MKTSLLSVGILVMVTAVGAQQGSQPKPAPARRPAAAPARSAEIEVTVHEGTSMSVSISPDGRTLATDMQGSIWTMPSAGGAMKR